MEQEMEMTRDELNKMTKRDLIEHIAKHGKKPQRKNILKGNLIDLIIKEGFNRPPPKRDESKTLESSEKLKASLKQWDMKTRFVEFSGEEIRGCKTDADLDDLIKTKMEPVQYMGEGELNQLD